MRDQQGEPAPVSVEVPIAGRIPLQQGQTGTAPAAPTEAPGQSGLAARLALPVAVPAALALLPGGPEHRLLRADDSSDRTLVLLFRRHPAGGSRRHDGSS